MALTCSREVRKPALPIKHNHQLIALMKLHLASTDLGTRNIDKIALAEFRSCCSLSSYSHMFCTTNLFDVLDDGDQDGIPARRHYLI